MGQLSETQRTAYTTSDIRRFADFIDYIGRSLKLYDETGNPAYLPHKGDSQMIEFLCHLGKGMAAIHELAETRLTTQALGTFVVYKWTYAQVSGDPDFLPWSTVSGSRPTFDNQLLVWKNGMAETSYTVGATGIQLGTALESGDIVTVHKLSETLRSAYQKYVYDGSEGTGTGNLTWDIADLGEDNFGNQPSAVLLPSTSTKLWVFRNGQLMTQNTDYNATVGSGSAEVVFTSSDPDFAILDDEQVVFLVWQD